MLNFIKSFLESMTFLTFSSSMSIFDLVWITLVINLCINISVYFAFFVVPLIIFSAFMKEYSDEEDPTPEQI